MDQQNIENQIGYLTGQMNGLLSFVSTIIEIHPSPNDLARYFEIYSERNMAADPSPPEAAARGQREMILSIRKLIQAAKASSSSNESGRGAN